MTRRSCRFTALALLVAALLPWSSAGAGTGPQAGSGPSAPLGAGFTYQGRLEDAGGPVTAACDFQFGLWDAVTGPAQLGVTHELLDVAVTGGLFTVALNDAGQFGANAFSGEARWLEVAVRCPAGGGAYAALTPRQPLTAAPYASYAPAAGTVPWAGLTGVPAGFADGVDDNTTYSPGFGLDLDGLTFNIEAATIQVRVSGTCPPGSSVRAIYGDGSVQCWTDAGFNRADPPAANIITTADGAEPVGLHTSITIGSDGLGVISYYDYTNSDLKVAHCQDMDCTDVWTVYVNGWNWNLGFYTAITIGADGFPLISYRDSSGSLHVAHCRDYYCMDSQISILDYLGGIPQGTSITIGADGLGLISYMDYLHGRLKVAHCSNAACTTSTITALDTTPNAGAYNSITAGADGLGLISYFDGEGGLKVAHCSNANCTAATLTTLDSTASVGEFTSITLGTDGLGLISYFDASHGDLKVAHCSNTNCTAATLTTLDNGALVGHYTSITVGADGLGLVSYYDVMNGDLRVAHCSNTDCTAATVTTVVSANDAGQYSSITVGADGFPLISYFDETDAALKVVHCTSAFCTPYLRRR